MYYKTVFKEKGELITESISQMSKHFETEHSLHMQQEKHRSQTHIKALIDSHLSHTCEPDRAMTPRAVAQTAVNWS